MSKLVNDLRFWIESQSTKLCLPELNQLVDLYVTSDDDSEVSMLTESILGTSPPIKLFLIELMTRRVKCGISSKSNIISDEFPKFGSFNTSSKFNNKAKQSEPNNIFDTTEGVKDNVTPNSNVTNSIMNSSQGISASQTPKYMYGEEDESVIHLSKEERLKKDIEQHLQEFPELVTEHKHVSEKPLLPSQQEFLSKVKVKKPKNKKKITTTNKGLVISSTEREACDCMCREHPLLGNCIGCGRIVCELEGEGPCYFCGSFVGSIVKNVACTVNPEFIDVMRETTLYSGGHRYNKRRVFELVAEGIDPYSEPYLKYLNMDEGDGVGSDYMTDAGVVSSVALRDASIYKLASSVDTSTNEAREAAGLKQAQKFRDTILHRAQVNNFTQNIRDEQGDYYEFEGNVWMDEEERKRKEELAAAMEAEVERLKDTYTVDVDISTGQISSKNYFEDMVWTGHGAVGGNEDVLTAAEKELTSREEARKEAEERTRQTGVNVTIGPDSKMYGLREMQEKRKLQLEERRKEAEDAKKKGMLALTEDDNANSHIDNTVDTIPINASSSGKVLDRGSTHLADMAKDVYDEIRDLISKAQPDSKSSHLLKTSHSAIQRRTWKGNDGVFDEVAVLGVDADDTSANDVNDGGCVLKRGFFGSEVFDWDDVERWEINQANNENLVINVDSNISPIDIKPVKNLEKLAKEQAILMLGDYLSKNYKKQGFTSRTDEGMCLTLHQPYASLMVYGLKRFEGRVWKPDFKGRLWIHAAAKEPEPEDITRLEQECRDVYGDKSEDLEWPTSYPTSALLGAVDSVDCWSHDQFKDYRDKHLDKFRIEENHSNFVFVCVNSRRLITPISMKGEHKLWKLDGAIHKHISDNLIHVNVDPELFKR